MKTISTKAIILNRTNFQEADRILTALTPDHGKVRLIAKGVRKERSKLAGGVELFSISEITFIEGRAEISTLVSSRLDKHFANVVRDINKSMLAYELLKIINKSTEESSEQSYFDLLGSALTALDDKQAAAELVELWFSLGLLKISGHAPNLKHDSSGQDLYETEHYSFDNKTMAFEPGKYGAFTTGHIKLLRLALTHEFKVLIKVNGAEQFLEEARQLAISMRRYHLHV